MIGLVDGNNFYVSCERIFDPTLEGKPVAVLSNNDGCVISRSAEFKALGIPMGTPFFQLKPLMADRGLILKSSNYALYGDISRRVIAILRDFTPDVEQYSIDEAFIRVELPAGADYFEFGRKIRRTLLKQIGIPCGIGFAATRTLAKIANHIGKKEPDGVFVMPEDPHPVLDQLPVSEVWGIGHRLAPKLERLGIRTAWQLSCRDVSAMQKKFSVSLGRTILELRGISCIEGNPAEEPSRSISCSRSFGYPVVDFDELCESIAAYTAGAAEKLRRERLLAAGVNVYFQMYPEYGPVRREGGMSCGTIVFPEPTDDTGKMMTAVKPELRKMFIAGRRYKKSGVVFFGLESSLDRQQDLFSASQQGEASELYRVVDLLNAKFGRGTIFLMGEGIRKPWRMRRELLSPGYTTNWGELLNVK